MANVGPTRSSGQIGSSPLSNHVKLTDDERKDVATFWGYYFRSSGEGRQPTAFQLDAINDAEVRDAFLFWQIAANPEDFNPGFAEKIKMLALIETFGANPTGQQVHAALKKIIANVTSQGAEVDDIDTTTVWTVAHVMWLLLGGAWMDALSEMEQMVEVVSAYQKVNPENKYPHNDPLGGFGLAAGLLGLHAASGGDQHAMELAAKMYGLDENAENTRWARDSYAHIRAERFKNAAA